MQYSLDIALTNGSLAPSSIWREAEDGITGIGQGVVDDLLDPTPGKVFQYPSGDGDTTFVRVDSILYVNVRTRESA